jgi:hypothetical protein
MSHYRALVIPASSVIPAKAGIQYFQSVIDSRLRGSDLIFDF